MDFSIGNNFSEDPAKKTLSLFHYLPAMQAHVISKCKVRQWMAVCVCVCVTGILLVCRSSKAIQLDTAHIGGGGGGWTVGMHQKWFELVTNSEQSTIEHRRTADNEFDSVSLSLSRTLRWRFVGCRCCFFHSIDSGIATLPFCSLSHQLFHYLV